MKTRLLLPLLLLCLPLAVAGTTSEPIPLEDFFGPYNVSSPELSPDGTKIAFLAPVNQRMVLCVFDLQTGKAREIVHGTDESIRGFFWKGNAHMVFYADFGGTESYFIGTTDLTGRHLIRLAESQKLDQMSYGTSASINNDLRFDPDHIVLQGVNLPRDANGIAVNAAPALMKVDVETGQKFSFYTFESTDRETLLDNTGRLRVREVEYGHDITWQAKDTDEKDFHDVVHAKLHGYAEDWEPWEFGADNQTFYVLSRQQYDHGALYAYNIRTREMGAPIFVPPEGEIDRLILSYDRSKLYGVRYDADKEQYHWFDPAEAAIYAKLQKTFPGELVDVVSRCADEHLEIIFVHSDRDPGTFYILDRRRGGLILFKRVRDLDPRRMQPVQPIVFKARDGLELHGYLTLPANAKGRRVPLVIHPHGGPYGVRDTWRFDPEVQFLASRGYAVLQVNYRGSGGYGREFLDKGRYQWGRAMQDDLTDGVRWAIAEGIADPARVAIYGASYGGYAALAGVTLTPDLYCCAVNYVGAADLTITFNSNSAYYSPFDYQKTWIGKDRAYLEETSPLAHIDQIRVPTLHAYGDNDPRVKIKHWHRLEAALKRYNKTYQAIEEPNQGHGFRNAAASINFYRTMERFLAQYLAPERPAPRG